MQAATVAGGVVVNQNQEILVVNQHGKSWSLPKGHVEFGEDILAAAKREIHEESGVTKLEYIAELGSYERMGGKDLQELKRIIIFLFKTNEMKLQPIDPSNPEARWIHPEEVVHFLSFEKDKEFWLSIKDKIQKQCAQN
jgi:8-oxo-dGTP diphosphatase